MPSPGDHLLGICRTSYLICNLYFISSQTKKTQTKQNQNPKTQKKPNQKEKKSKTNRKLEKLQQPQNFTETTDFTEIHPGRNLS